MQPADGCQLFAQCCQVPFSLPYTTKKFGFCCPIWVWRGLFWISSIYFLQWFQADLCFFFELLVVLDSSGIVLIFFSNLLKRYVYLNFPYILPWSQLKHCPNWTIVLSIFLEVALLECPCISLISSQPNINLYDCLLVLKAYFIILHTFFNKGRKPAEI